MNIFRKILGSAYALLIIPVGAIFFGYTTYLDITISILSPLVFLLGAIGGWKSNLNRKVRIFLLVLPVIWVGLVVSDILLSDVFLPERID